MQSLSISFRSLSFFFISDHKSVGEKKVFWCNDQSLQVARDMEKRASKFGVRDKCETIIHHVVDEKLCRAPAKEEKEEKNYLMLFKLPLLAFFFTHSHRAECHESWSIINHIIFIHIAQRAHWRWSLFWFTRSFYDTIALLFSSFLLLPSQQQKQQFLTHKKEPFQCCSLAQGKIILRLGLLKSNWRTWSITNFWSAHNNKDSFLFSFLPIRHM